MCCHSQAQAAKKKKSSSMSNHCQNGLKHANKEDGLFPLLSVILKIQGVQ